MFGDLALVGDYDSQHYLTAPSTGARFAFAVPTWANGSCRPVSDSRTPLAMTKQNRATKNSNKINGRVLSHILWNVQQAYSTDPGRWPLPRG
jgi:hypothetical protein